MGQQLLGAYVVVSLVAVLYAFYFLARGWKRYEGVEGEGPWWLTFTGLAAYSGFAYTVWTYPLVSEPGLLRTVYQLASGAFLIAHLLIYTPLVMRFAYRKQETPVVETPQSPLVKEIVEKLSIPKPLISPVTTVLNRHQNVLEETRATSYNLGDQHNPADRVAWCINTMGKHLPNTALIAPPGYGQSWGGGYFWPYLGPETRPEDEVMRAAYSNLPDKLWQDISAIKVPIQIPEPLRNEHHHIVAGIGHGKSSCIKQLVMADVEAGHSVVVIDSQTDLINQLAPRIPDERLILIDPTTCPPALNIFAAEASGERDINTATELYEYIFNALGVELTGQQSMAYRFLSRLCLAVPGASIFDMLHMLEPNGTERYQEHIDQLPETTQSFFRKFQVEKGGEYKLTKEAIHRRLLALLENGTIASMLGADDMRFNMAAALDSGKVVLISTAKDHLKQTGSSLFGRIFIAQVMQAVMGRAQGKRKRTYLYIDEFQDYAEDSHVLFNLFEQGRKYELGVIVAHQYLGQLPVKLTQSLSANTAIKFAGGVSASDARALAPQMRTDHERIFEQPKGVFTAYFKGYGTVFYAVQLTKYTRDPNDELLERVHERMRREYGPRTPPPPPSHEPDPEPPVTPKTGPSGPTVTHTRSEKMDGEAAPQTTVNLTQVNINVTPPEKRKPEGPIIDVTPSEPTSPSREHSAQNPSRLPPGQRNLGHRKNPDDVDEAGEW